jgi:hypothetical protein
MGHASIADHSASRPPSTQRAADRPVPDRAGWAAGLLGLQRAAGNRAVGRLIAARPRERRLSRDFWDTLFKPVLPDPNPTAVTPRFDVWAEWDGPEPARPPVEAAQSAPVPATDRMLALQRTAGNRAARRLLARTPDPSPSADTHAAPHYRPITAARGGGPRPGPAHKRRVPGRAPTGRKSPKPPAAAPFRGDGKHLPTDAAYATELGKADAARLKAAGSLSDADRASIKAKLAWFEGAGRVAYLAQVRPALVAFGRPASDIDPDVQTEYILARTRLEAAVAHAFGQIQKLQYDAIVTWEKNARIPESKLGLEVLEFAVAVVSEGLGGVVLKVIDDALEHRTGKYVREFAALAGLEVTDKGLEDAYAAAVNRARTSIDVGIKVANEATIATRKPKKTIRETCKTALATKGDTLDAYTEALRRQTINEEDEQFAGFQEEAVGLDDHGVIERIAALTTIRKQLDEHPEPYQQEITAGFLAMLDEALLRSKDRDYGGSRERTFREDREAHTGWMRAGNLVISGPKSLGKWDHPDLDFSEVHVTAGGLNPEVLDDLKGMALQDLRMTLSFEFSAVDPYTFVFGSEGSTPIFFVRDRDGRIYLDTTGDSEEWLASYYTFKDAEHSDEERKRFAPLGAAKLYDHIRTKTIGDIKHVKV